MTGKIDFLTPITKISGFGGTRGTAMIRAGIKTAGDLLTLAPSTYLDFSRTVGFREFHYTEQFPVAIGGIVQHLTVPPYSPEIELTISNGNESVTVPVKIHRTLFRDLKAGTMVKICRISQNRHELLILKSEALAQLPFSPSYRITEQMEQSGISGQFLVEIIHKLIHSSGSFPERLPASIENHYRFPSLATALSELHFPKSKEIHHLTHQRIRYEQFYQTAIALRWNRKNYALPGVIKNDFTLQNRCIESLNFELTAEQKATIQSLAEISQSTARIHHIIQSESGCGKIVVALLTALPSLKYQGQIVWVCSSDRSAEMQFRTITELLSPVAIAPELLCSSTPESKRLQTIRSLKTGEIPLLITTEKLFDSITGFNRLQMIVLDRPDHCSPVQRTQLQRKGASADLLILRDHPLTEIDRHIFFSDLIQIKMNERVLPDRSARMRSVEPNRHEAMFRYLSERISNGDLLLGISPEPEHHEQRVTAESIETLLPEGKEIVSIPESLTENDLDEVAQKIKSGTVAIIHCRSRHDLPDFVDQVQLAVIDHAEQISPNDIASIRRELLVQSDSSWLFILTENKNPEHLHDAPDIEFFKQVASDLENVLKPE